jgi:phosphate transport system substrate-binding protein
MKIKTALPSILAATLTVLATNVLAVTAMPALAAPAHDGVVQLNGSGATFPQPLYEEWAFTYNKSVDTNVLINYSGVGSGQGKKDILNGTVDFAGSDAKLTDAEAKQKPLVQLPTVAGAVVVAFNVPGVKDLTLDADTLAGIYLGKIAKWNDAAIKKLNPSAALPDLTIVVVHRSDGSGTTNIFTSYLTVVSDEWRTTVKPPFNTTVDWPADKLKRGLGGRGNQGVAAAVQNTKGAIGYVELAYALNNKISFTKMINASGKTVSASTASTIAAMKDAWFDSRLASYIVNSRQAEAWPIAGFTYVIMPASFTDCQKGVKLIQWVVWGVTSPEAKAIALRQNYAPLPAEVVPTIGNRIKTISCNGQVLFP